MCAMFADPVGDSFPVAGCAGLRPFGGALIGRLRARAALQKLRSFDQDEDLTLSRSELVRVDWAAFSQEEFSRGSLVCQHPRR